jgi:threonine dehydratase
MQLPNRRDVEAAAARIAPVAVTTPLVRFDVLDRQTGGTVLLKLETLQRVGAFKFRGAYNAISRVPVAEFPGGVVACSSGNHAQGVAAAATLCGMRSLVVMPKDAPRLKMERTRAFGAEVVMYDRATEDRDAIALAAARDRQAAFVPPFDHADVISGQGTTGMEIMAQAKALGLKPESIVVPCSGGGLVAGIAAAVDAGHGGPDVYLVEPAAFDDFGRSLVAGTRQRNVSMTGSICDALMSEQPGQLTFALAQRHGIQALAVTDDEVRDAIRFAFRELKLVLEPGGAVALAALLTGKLPVAGRTVAVVLSGGNIDPADFAAIIQH